MIGRSVKMRELFAQLEKLARTDVTVTLIGETGTGRDVIAHGASTSARTAARRTPFVIFDCGARCRRT